MNRYFQYFLLFLIFVTISCNTGLSPEPETRKAGFGGKITFIGNWPDSVTQTHIVLFKDPLLLPQDFNAFNLKFVSDSINSGTTEFIYNSIDKKLFPANSDVEPGEYAYLAVAQSTAPSLSLLRKDWAVAGVYYTAGDSTRPGRLIIPQNTFVDSVNIICDFNNPPPQPPK